MGRPDSIEMRSAFASLRRKIARARHRRATVPCSVCGQLPTPEGHDACLGTLPGVQAACCGHGKTEGYVMFDSGQVIRGTFDHAPRKKAVPIRDLKVQISDEIYAVLERLGAEPELLAIVGSWGDRLGDAEVLSRLRKYNATGRVLHRPQ